MLNMLYEASNTQDWSMYCMVCRCISWFWRFIHCNISGSGLRANRYWLSAYSSMRRRFKWAINRRPIHRGTMRLGRFYPNKRQVCILAYGKAKKIRGTNCKARATTVCVVGRRGVRPKKRKRPSKKKKKVQLRKEKGTADIIYVSAIFLQILNQSCF